MGAPAVEPVAAVDEHAEKDYLAGTLLPEAADATTAVPGALEALLRIPGARASRGERGSSTAPHNKGLVADLCKIIERQSQEIASLMQTRNAHSLAPSTVPTVVEAPKSPSSSSHTLALSMSSDVVEYDGEAFRAICP